MGRMYVAPIDALSVAAIEEVFFLAAPSDAVVVVHEIKVTQDTSETSEQLPLNIFRTATNQSAKGTSITPAPLEVGDPAFGGTVRSGIVTADTFATETTMLFRESQNILNGWHFLPTPECRPVLSPGGYLDVKIDAAPSATIPVSGYIVFEEIGG
jgi:hypothetical protein